MSDLELLMRRRLPDGYAMDPFRVLAMLIVVAVIVLVVAL